MSEMQNPGTDYEKLFRNAAFGGFHKQDVLDYIERMVRNRKKDNEKFQESLKEAQKESGTLRSQLGTANTEREELRTQLNEVKDQLTKLQMENQALSEYNEAMKEETQQSSEQISALEKKLSAAAASEALYQQIRKDKAALEVQFADLQNELETSRCDASAHEAETACALQQVRSELETALEQIAQKDAQIAELQAALASAEEQAKEEPPAPVPSAQATADKVIIATLEARNSDLAARVSELEEKIRKNETDKLRLTAIEDAAYAKAKKIELEANAKAEEICTEASVKADSICAEAKQYTVEISDGIASVCSGLSQAQAALEEETAKATAMYAALIARAEELRKALAEK